MIRAFLRRFATPKLIGNALPLPLFTENLPEFRDKRMTTGRSWRAEELRLKSDDDLHKLWYVLLREKGVLLADSQLRVQHRQQRGPQDRMIKVKISMARLLTVVHERYLLREKYKAKLEKEYMDKTFPQPPPKPKTIYLRTDRELQKDAKRRQAIKAIKDWRSMSNLNRRKAISKEYGRMAKTAKEEFIKELRFVGQQLKAKQETATPSQ